MVHTDYLSYYYEKAEVMKKYWLGVWSFPTFDIGSIPLFLTVRDNVKEDNSFNLVSGGGSWLDLEKNGENHHRPLHIFEPLRYE